MAISWIWKFLHVFSTIVWSALTSGCWLRFLCCWCWCCCWFSGRSWCCGSEEKLHKVSLLFEFLLTEFFELGDLGLGFVTHDTTSPVFADLFESVVVVSLYAFNEF